MYDYAKEVNELRKETMSDFKRVKIIGEKSIEFGYSFAKGISGYIVEERILSENIPAYKIFTGNRIWIVPQDDCELYEENKK